MTPGRTLAAATTEHPAMSASGDDIDILHYLTDPETRLWSIVRELWAFGSRYHPLYARAQKLRDQLADPALTEEYPEEAAAARERLAGWQAELDHLDGEARLLCLGFQSLWHRIPEARRKALQREPAWPRPKRHMRIAGELWVMAKTGRPMVPGDAPFALVGFALAMLGVMA